jgi:alpha-amylase/alpha-mannosidase (GH57 family)
MSSAESIRADRWVCVHGHFYQPPRENPWTGLIDRQPSATPFHDWNQRIAAECYRANTAAAVMDSHGRVVRLVDNYACLSWNMGPTLLTWLREQERSTYESIILADRASRERFGGHGSALAQAHGHVIMPLASHRDKVTQVAWGIADFRWRFGRLPEGMWLPECAVDTETLEVMAAQGIAFTVLAPHQAAAWRPMRKPAAGWNRDAVDPGRVYRCPLPSGRSIDLFFYDGLLRLIGCLPTVQDSSSGCVAVGRWRPARQLRMHSHRCATLQPTVNRTVIIIALATWRWPGHLTRWRQIHVPA